MLSIIVVSWNNEDTIGKCVGSIPDAVGRHACRTIVVDNNSSDNTRGLVQRYEKDVDIVLNSVNSGFGAGVRIAWNRIHTKYVAVVNPDLVLSPRSLEKMVDFVECHEEIGMVGPKTIEDDGSVQCGPFLFPTPLSALKSVPLFGRYQKKKYAYSGDEKGRCDYLFGACMMFRKRSVDAIGGFPADTFMYGEEYILGARLKRDKWQVWYMPEVTVRHSGGTSSMKRWSVEELSRIKWNSKVIAYKVLFGPVSFLVWKLLVTIGLVLSIAASVFHGKTKRKQNAINRLRAVWKVAGQE